MYDEDGSIKYYVAYEGTVKAGIDVTRITVEIDEDADIRACALESAKAAERALIEPWVNQIEVGRTYTVRVLGYGEAAGVTYTVNWK